MKLNPRQIERAMKRMGIQSQDIAAEEVVITTTDKDIVISNPHVARVNMMGQDTFQVSGDVSERSRISAEDVAMVVEQTGVTEEEARRVLEQTGDIAESIIKLKGES